MIHNNNGTILTWSMEMGEAQTGYETTMETNDPKILI